MVPFIHYCHAHFVIYVHFPDIHSTATGSACCFVCTGKMMFAFHCMATSYTLHNMIRPHIYRRAPDRNSPFTAGLAIPIALRPALPQHKSTNIIAKATHSFFIFPPSFVGLSYFNTFFLIH